MIKVFCKEEKSIGDQDRGYHYEVGEWYDMKIYNSEICHVMDHNNGWCTFDIDDETPLQDKIYNNEARQGVGKRRSTEVGTVAGCSGWMYPRFSDHFQTVQEIRKLKLEQIRQEN